MTVHFIYRSPYDDPKLHQVKVFDDKTILEWFQRNWRAIEKHTEPEALIIDFMGEHVYGLDSLFEAIGEENLTNPGSIDELNRQLKQHLSLEGEFSLAPHCFQAITNDDELEMAYYLFDDKFSNEYPDKTAFLVQDWHLPARFAQISNFPMLECSSLEPAADGTGSVYCAFLSHYDCGDNLTDLKGAWRIGGLHLNQFAKFLTCNKLVKDIPLDDSWPTELLLLRSQMLLESEDMLDEERQLLRVLRVDLCNETNWQNYSDWMAHRGMDLGTVLLHRAMAECTKYPVSEMNCGIDWTVEDDFSRFKTKMPNMDHAKARTQFDEHIVQVSIHNDQWEHPKLDLYSRWIIFDDLWASANVDLAKSILTYASRWDVLSD